MPPVSRHTAADLAVFQSGRGPVAPPGVPARPPVGAAVALGPAPAASVRVGGDAAPAGSGDGEERPLLD